MKTKSMQNKLNLCKPKVHKIDDEWERQMLLGGKLSIEIYNFVMVSKILKYLVRLNRE